MLSRYRIRVPENEFSFWLFRNVFGANFSLQKLLSLPFPRSTRDIGGNLTSSLRCAVKYIVIQLFFFFLSSLNSKTDKDGERQEQEMYEWSELFVFNLHRVELLTEKTPAPQFFGLLQIDVCYLK